ncbi:MAG TPA: MerR family transcriptional regulator [Homoserinimonas sp.]|nr:MerR family transcriptional regulator [Homoserinimonas sp.]
MRISELVRRSGVPLATIKYYIREGLLMPGETTSATQASYDDEHLRRLGLIRALTDVAGLPLQKARIVIGLIEHPQPSLFETLGKAVEALPPYADANETADYPRAKAALEKIGQLYDPRYAAVAQFERALAAAESVGLAMSDERLLGYARQIMAIAELDLGEVPTGAVQDAVEYSVLGTALYEPIIVAMRRLAHQDLAARRFGG